MRRKACAIWFCLFWFAIYGSSLKANMVYPLEIFTGEGAYYDSLDLNLYVEAANGQSIVNFTFRNESSIDSSIARIYFDDGLHLGSIANIVGSSGTSFSQIAVLGNLPAAKLLDPVFETTNAFSVDSDPPPPHNGVNPGQWVTISFGLIGGGTFEGVINGLNTGSLRIGVHVIGLPDDSGGSAIAVPEPATLMILGTAGLWIFTRKRQFFRRFRSKSNLGF